MLKKRIREFLQVCPKELLGTLEPATYYDLRRILISRNNIKAGSNLLDSIYCFNQTWSEKAGPRILLTCFMIKYFPRWGSTLSKIKPNTSLRFIIVMI